MEFQALFLKVTHVFDTHLHDDHISGGRVIAEKMGAIYWLPPNLRESLYKRYRELSEELIVLPAHFMSIDELNGNGSVSERLGTLFVKNHGLNIEDENVFRKMVTEDLPPQPNSYQEIRETYRKN